jgi:cytochrome c oxidase cbb3-type subunit 3
MGQVLITMGKQALEKNKRQDKALSVIMLIGFSFLSLVTNGQGTAVTEKVNIVPNYGGMDSTSFWILATVIFTEIIVIAFIMFSIRRIQTELLPQKEKVRSVVLKEWWSRLDKKLFTRAVSVEKEADILMDHDYDGIKELDNALPPWWKYGFIITIVVAFLYLLNFHVLGYGKNPTEEYQEEIAKAQEAKELFEAKNVDKVDELNLQMPDAAGINAGKEIFTTVCWACHGKLGEGGAGPNLTDDYWIHKGSLTDIYLSIKHGYADKGMQSWEKNYSPKEINNLAGYIKTLKGTNPPNPKAPQGDIYLETATADSTLVKPMNAADSLKKDPAKIIKKDSVKTKKN